MMVCPAKGAAVTVVPGVAVGGGVGLLERKSGCMCSSLENARGRFLREVGLEKLGGLEGRVLDGGGLDGGKLEGGGLDGGLEIT